MKRFLIIPAALALANCTPSLTGVDNITQAVVVNKDKVLVPATQALIIAHNAYQGAAALATGAVKACTLTPTFGPCPTLKTKLPQLAALNDRAKALLDQADRGQNIAENAAEVMNIVSDMQLITER